MNNYIKRLLIFGIIALCVSLFYGGKQTKASTVAGDTEEKVDWIWPADGIISDTYGTRHGRHKGIDIAGALNSPILSVESGMVEKSYYSNSYGNVIFIKHPSNYVTVYAHLRSRLVKEGQNVKKGDVIGKMGNTGQSTGVHLHFETHKMEWTYDKKFALNPIILLGQVKLGEFVQAGSTNEKIVLEASSKMHSQNREEKNQILQSNRATTKKSRANVYIVKFGDTLWSIANRYKVSVKNIKNFNTLSSDTIKPKQVLNIP